MDSVYEFFIGIFNFFILIFSILFTPAEDMCGLDVAHVVISPNNQYKAIIYQYDCGATTPFTTNVSILEVDQDLKYEPGNLFSAYHGSVSGEWHGPYVEVKWLNINSISITYVKDAKITEKIEAIGPVSAKYLIFEIEDAEERSIKHREKNK